MDEPKMNEAVIRSMLRGFVNDPPDDAYQAGFLGGLLVVANEIMGIEKSDPLWIEADSCLTLNEIYDRNSAAAKRSAFKIIDGGKPKTE
jgi:hypothetical protein